MKIFFTLGVYALFCVLLFYANLREFNVNRSFEFWYQFIVLTAISFAYGVFSYRVLRHPETPGKKMFFLAPAFFLLVFFFMRPPWYVLDDMRIYFFHAKIFVVYNENPYAVIPADFMNDAVYVFVRDWRTQNFNYGPLWLFISALPVFFTKNIVAAAWMYKAISALFFIASGWLVGRIFNNRKYAFLFALNPVVLFWGIASGHNDIAMLFFLLASLLFLKHRLFVWSFVFLGLAALIKYTALIALIAYIPYVFSRETSKKNAAVIFLRACVSCAFVIVVFYAFFGINSSAVSGSLGLANFGLTGPLYSFFSRYAPWVAEKTVSIGILFIGLALIAFYRPAHDIGSLARKITYLFIWFFLITFWFQPWYLIWIVPFLWFASEWRAAFFATVISWYALMYYLMFYTFSSAVGLVMTVFFFLPIFLVLRAYFSSKKGAFLAKKQGN